MQMMFNLSAVCQHGRFSLLWRWSFTCLSISVAVANSWHWCKIIIRLNTYLTKFMVMILVHTGYTDDLWSCVFTSLLLVGDSCQKAVVNVLFTSDIWRSLTVLIKFSLCQLRNTTQFSSLLLLKLPWHFRSRLFQDCIAKLVIAMKMITECHQYVEKEISLSYQVDLASEWETQPLFIPDELWTLVLGQVFLQVTMGALSSCSCAISTEVLPLC